MPARRPVDNDADPGYLANPSFALPGGRGAGLYTRNDDNPGYYSPSFTDPSGRNIQVFTPDQLEGNQIPENFGVSNLQEYARRGVPINIDGKDWVAIDPSMASHPAFPTAGAYLDEDLGIYLVDGDEYARAHPYSPTFGSLLAEALIGGGMAAFGGAALGGLLPGGTPIWGGGAAAGTGAGTGATGGGVITGGGAGGIPPATAGDFAAGGLGADFGGTLTPDLWSEAVGGLNAETQGILNATGTGAIPGVTPATTGGFTADQLIAAGVNPSTVGLPMPPGPNVPVPPGLPTLPDGPGTLPTTNTGGTNIPGTPTGTPNVPGTGTGGLTDLLRGINWGDILRGVIGGAGQYFSSEHLADELGRISDRNFGIGEPYRDLLLGSYQPGFDLLSQPGYGDALDRIGELSTRSWAPAGNPANNPGIAGNIMNDVWTQGYIPALNTYRGGLQTAGNMGLEDSTRTAMAAAGMMNNAYGGIGYGANNVLNGIFGSGQSNQQNPFSSLTNVGQGALNHFLQTGEGPTQRGTNGNPWTMRSF